MHLKIYAAALLCATWATSIAQNNTGGTILDSQTKEPLAFAVIVNLNSETRSTSDLQGHFSIAAIEGKDSILVSMLGYDRKVVLATANASIELTTSTIALSEIVVSTNREAEKRSEAPVAIHSISASTISDNKPTTIDQVLNQSPGVNMVDLGNEQHTMSIRRPIDYGASYLYLEDGIPIRASGVFNHNALLEINMANTSKIEIIRGPASSMYGSEAIGGAINFVSKRPSINPTGGISVQANNIGYRRTDFYASNTFNKKLAVRLAGYYANQTNGTLAHSDFDKLALSLTANYYLNEQTEITWSNTLVDYFSDMAGSLDSTDFYSKSYGSNQTFTNRQVNAYRSRVTFSKYHSEDSKTSLTGYFRVNSVGQNPAYRISDDFRPWIPAGNPNLAHGEINDNSFRSFGFIAQHKQNFNWLNSSLILGSSLDFSPNTYQANYIRIDKNDDEIYESFTKTDSLLADYQSNLINTAAYIQVKAEPITHLNIIVSLRFDYFNYNFTNHLDSNAFTAVVDGKNTFYRATPKLGLTYDLNKGGIYANYSQGFVPPQVSELYRGQKAPSIKPVYYDSYEIGGWVTFANGKGKMDVSIYRMDGLNEIVSVLQDDGATIRQDAGKTTHQGIEYAILTQPFRDLSIRLSGTNARHEFTKYDESDVDYGGKDMPQAPKWIANMQATYKPSYLQGFRLSLEWQHIDKYFMSAQNNLLYSGYDIFNLRAGYEFRSFEIWTNILNLTDELYATVANASAWGQSYSLGNPRNINIGLAYHFQQNK